MVPGLSEQQMGGSQQHLTKDLQSKQNYLSVCVCVTVGGVEGWDSTGAKLGSPEALPPPDPPSPSAAHLLHVSIEAEDVENTIAVHLRLVQAIDHQNGAVGVGAVLRRGWRRRGVPVLRPVAAGSSVAAPHGRPHPPPFVMRRRRAVAFVVVVAVVAPVRSSCRREPKSAWAKQDEGQRRRCPTHRPGLTVFRRMIPKERRLPLALVWIPARLPCQKQTNIRNFWKRLSRLDFWG